MFQGNMLILKISSTSDYCVVRHQTFDHISRWPRAFPIDRGRKWRNRQTNFFISGQTLITDMINRRTKANGALPQERYLYNMDQVLDIQIPFSLSFL